MARPDPDRELDRFLLDLLGGIGPVEPRRLFGATALWLDGVVFGLIFEDRLYLKVDDLSRPDFEAAGQESLGYQRQGRPAALKSFYTMPEDAMDDADAALAWARRGIDAALRAQTKKWPKRPPRKPQRRRAKPEG